MRRGFYILCLYRFLTCVVLIPLKESLTTISPGEKYIFTWIALLIGFTILSVPIYSSVKAHRKRSILFFYGQLIADVVFVEVLILLTGGIESWFSFLFIILTIVSAVVIGRRGGYIIGTMAGLIYGAMIDLQYYGLLPVRYDTNYQFREFFYNISLNFLGIYLTAFLMAHLLKRLERTSESLLKKDTDLRELVKFQSEVIENIPSGLFTTDNSGRITLFNSAAEKITGKAAQEVYARPITEVFPFLSLPLSTGRLQGTISRGGKPVFIGMNISEYTNAQGEKVGYIGTFQDVTKIIQMEEMVKRKEKLAAIGELSASIAHELRNPLASIKSSFEMLRENHLPEETRRRLMDIAISEMDRLNRIVRDFLLYSNPRPPEKSEFSLTKMVEDVIDAFSNTHEGVNFSTDIKGEINIIADEGKIRQVLWNVLSNAVDATKGKGEGEVRVIVDRDMQKAIIKVMDNGCGIQEADLEKVFYPFFSRKEHGTGLGLAIAYRIIEEHGGTITVRSKVNEGSEFTILLPLEDR